MRQRISAVMQWAVAMEFRTDNPSASERRSGANGTC